MKSRPVNHAFGRRGMFLLILTTLCLSVAFAQDRGNPLLRNYTPQDYGGHIQVWEVTQSRFGHIIFGTGTGLMYYDGTRFGNVENSNSMTTRLITTSDGDIFYASRGRFGKVVLSESGGYRIEPIYRPTESSTLNLTAEAVAMHDFNGAVWLTNFNGLFRFANDELTEVAVADTLHHIFYKSFIVNNQIVAVSTTAGLYQTDAQAVLRKIPESEFILEDNGAYIPEFIVPYDSGRYLYGTARKGLFFITHPMKTGSKREALLRFSTKPTIS